MAATYEPLVLIDGAQVSPGWSSIDPTALEPVTIDWGAKSHYDEVPPAVLTLEIVHPATAGIEIALYQNRRVEIWLEARTPTADPTRVDGARRIFKGTVSGVVWRRVQSWDEATGQNLAFWVARITATDSTAQVRQLVPAGTGDPATSPGHYRNFQRLWYETAGYAPAYLDYTSTVSNRYWATLANLGAAIDAALSSGHVSSVVRRWDAAPARAYRAGNDRPTVWELLREVYGTVPLSEPSYNPNDDEITYTEPVTMPGVPLVYTGGTLTISQTDPLEIGLNVVPADALEVSDESYEVTTDGATRIGTVEITTTHIQETSLDVTTPNGIPTIPVGTYPTWPVWDWKQEKREHVRAVAGGESTAYRRELWMTTRDQPRTSPPIVQDDSDTSASFLHDQVINRIRDAVAELNGSTPPPEATFDLERSGDLISPTLARGLLQPWPSYYRNRPLLILGSLTTGEIGTESIVQIIGGKLEYSGGWRHTLRWAPTRATARAELTYAQLVTNTVATYNSWDDQISYGDFAAITQGAS